MPAFGMSTAKRKGGTSTMAQRASNHGGDATHSVKEVGSTMFRSAASGVLPATSVGVSFSAATYQASSPCGDVTILETDASGSRPHVFAAVIHAERTAHGGEHLSRHLYREVLQQLKMSSGGDPLAAIKAALVTLDLKFRSLHLYHSHILAGVQITAVWLDLASNRLHLVSNGGGARAVVASARAGAPEVVIELGRSAPATAASSRAASFNGSRGSAAASLFSAADSLASSRTTVLSRQASASGETVETEAAAAAAAAAVPAVPQRLSDGARILPAGTATVQLTEDVDHIILGSPGLWNELTADQAASRAQGLAASAPHAAGGNAAAHIAQLALQAVCERTKRQQSDPRMASLQLVSDLQQLWVGSRANYKWGGRQPLRRRRGDVHGDVSAVVLRLDWDGGPTLRKDSMPSKLQRVGSAAAMPKAGAGSFGDLRAKGLASHWDLVRLHFMQWRPRARAAALARWHAAVDAALAAAAAERAAAAAVRAAPTSEASAVSPPSQQQQHQAQQQQHAVPSAAPVLAQTEVSKLATQRAATPFLAVPSAVAARIPLPDEPVSQPRGGAAEPQAAIAQPPAGKSAAGGDGRLVSLVARASGSWRGVRPSLLAAPRASLEPRAQHPPLERSTSSPMSLRARFAGLPAMVSPSHEAQDAVASDTAALRKALGGFSRRRLQVSSPLQASPSVAVH